MSDLQIIYCEEQNTSQKRRESETNIDDHNEDNCKTKENEN